MTFDDWMRARSPKYCPTDDNVTLRELRDCWATAERHSDRAQERERMIELMRDKCRKVGVGETAITDADRLEWLMRNVSGKEFRRLGVTYGGNCGRDRIDAAMVGHNAKLTGSPGFSGESVLDAGLGVAVLPAPTFEKGEQA